MNCNYKVKIKDIQNKYQFKIFCKTYDDTEIQEDIDTLEDDVEALQEENAYLNNLVEQAFDKKEVEGEELSINDTIEAKMNVSLYGNTKQETTTGKNLLPITRSKGYSVTSNGVTFTINDDYSVSIKGTATATASINLVTTSFPFTLKAGTYTLSKGNKSKEQLAIWYGDSSILRAVTDNTDTSTFTINQNTTYEKFRTLVVVYKDDTVDDIIYPMLEQGSTATTYEPYTNGASPNPDYPQKIQRVTGNNKVVVSNKNLFDKDNANILNGYINGATKTYQELSTAKSCYISIKPNTTYTISKISSQRFGLATFNTEIINGTTATIIGSPKSTDTSYTITTGGNDKYLVVFYYLSTADTLSEETIRNSIQIEQGSTATSYVPHKETIYELDLGNIELCKIGNYQDYFYKNNNKWYKREVIGSVRLDGLNWTAEKISNDIYRMISTKSIFKGETEVSKISELFCNIYKKGSANMTYLKQTSINLYKNFIYVYDSNYNTSTSVDSFKTMLKEKNAILYGILPEPRDIEITDTTLISQLEALKTAMSYTEQTNISQINDDIPFILKVTALASYNSRIVALENAILNANRSTQTKNARKSNEIIEETKKEVVDDNKDENIIKEEK